MFGRYGLRGLRMRLNLNVNIGRNTPLVADVVWDYLSGKGAVCCVPVQVESDGSVCHPDLRKEDKSPLEERIKLSLMNLRGSSN